MLLFFIIVSPFRVLSLKLNEISNSGSVASINLTKTMLALLINQ